MLEERHPIGYDVQKRDSQHEDIDFLTVKGTDQRLVPREALWPTHFAEGSLDLGRQVLHRLLCHLGELVCVVDLEGIC
jgi:hypothetical protein